MRFWIVLYYLLFLLNGGYRNFPFEYEAIGSTSGFFYNDTVYLIILIAQIFLLFLVALTVVFIENKWLHLSVFMTILALDLYFHNGVKYENSIILTNLVPGFVFLIAHLKNRHTTRELLVGYLCIGYTISAIGKIQGGWLNSSDLVVYQYYLNFNELAPNTLLPFNFVQATFHPVLWKSFDYITILYQLDAILLLFYRNLLKYFLLLATIFHIVILIVIQIPIFYTYIIFYGIVLGFEYGETLTTATNDRKQRWIALSATGVIAGIYHSDIFEQLSLQIMLHKDFCLTIVCALLFLFSWIRYAVREKRYEPLQNA